MPTEGGGGDLDQFLLSETSEILPLRDGLRAKAKKVRLPKASSKDSSSKARPEPKARPSSTNSLGSLGEKFTGSNLRSLDAEGDEDMQPANI